MWNVALWSDGLYTSAPSSCAPGATAFRRSNTTAIEVARTYPEIDQNGNLWRVALWADGVYTKVPLQPSPAVERTPGPASAFGPTLVRSYPEREADGDLVVVHHWSDGQFTVRVVPCILPQSAVTIQFSQAADGSVVGQGLATNSCDSFIGMMVETVAVRDGQPIIDAPTVFIREIPPRSALPFTTRLPAVAGPTGFRTTFSYLNGGERLSLCLDVQTTRCLRIDPWLASTARQLETLERGQWLLKVAAENNVRIFSEVTPIGIRGIYTRPTRTIVIDARLDGFSSLVRAAILAHELQHAADDAAGLAPQTVAQCFRAEGDAFRRQAEVWSQFWLNDLPANVDLLHAELNNIALTVAHDPAGFAATLAELYRHQCGG